MERIPFEKFEKTNADEIVAEFLKAEYTSEIFGDRLRQALEKFNADGKLITEPDLMNTADNELRKKILGMHRGYGNDEKLFSGFPEDIVWYKAKFTVDQLKQVRYIDDHEYWSEISGGTRLATDAVKNILAGKLVYNESNQKFFTAAEAIKKGTVFPRMILVAKDENSPIVVLEGHHRLTAYLLAAEFVRQPIEVFIGYSKDLDKWGLY